MITVESSGRVLFRVYLPHAGRVEILGGFTDWSERPIPMQAEGDGWWTAEAEIPSGDWRFRYRMDGDLWATDFAAHGVDLNAFGSLDSCLRVAPAVATRLAA